MDKYIKMLVVDENPDAANLSVEHLRLFGIDVVVVHGNSEGFALAEAQLPKIIFFNLCLPEIDGYMG